jgi:esterase/lipase/1-acyl-sn-glycerol-3-phosphate acyltransferase
MAEINRFAFSISKLGLRTLERLSKASVHVHNDREIPDGAIIFVVNHFTRLETFVLPYELNKLTGKPVMSLAHYSLFTGTLGAYLEKVGAVSTKDPERDKIIIRSLLVDGSPWLFFPEGAMIKDKKVIEKDKFRIYCSTGTRRPPHTGAAVLALRAEIYRRRLSYLQENAPDLLQRQLKVFDISSMEELTNREIYLVPINVTYYPIRSRENAIERFATHIVKGIPERLQEELQTEGTMILSGVDIDICLGKPMPIKHLLKQRRFHNDIIAPQPIMPNDVLPSRPLMCRIARKMTVKAMGTIYNMTTVNHDHLSAYLLKYYPGRRLTLFDLSQRLYLASLAVRKLNSIRFHESLYHDQSLELCHEYRQKLEDFLLVAEKSGVVKKEGDIIHKKRSKVSALFDFHTIRSENTYQVILNEVEYLHPLTRKLRIIAWYPRWFICWRMRRQFCQLEKVNFITDYNTYYRENESKPMNIGAPFFLKHLRAKIGILLVHGYLAAPEEVRPFAENLHQHGYAVYAPRLLGHGTSPEDLAQRSWKDWLESVEHGCLVLANSCKKVVLGGFSTGATLALLGAVNNLHNIKAVFAINPAFRLRKRSAKFAPAMVIWNKLADKLVNDEGRQHFVPSETENPDINYSRNPISAVKELMELMDTATQRLREITVPVLIIQSSDDPIVHPKGSELLYQGLGSKDKELIVFPSTRHGIIRGEGSERVFASVVKFLNSKV